jgi:CheY-like chemotaxis protein
MKVLIVDDEPRIVDGVRKYFEQAGFNVLAAYDGTSGLSLARAEGPDLVVLDLMMPGMDGLDVCRELRRTPTSLNAFIAPTAPAVATPAAVDWGFPSPAVWSRRMAGVFGRTASRGKGARSPFRSPARCAILVIMLAWLRPGQFTGGKFYMRKMILLALLIGLLVVSFGCTSSDEAELTGDEVVQLVFFWSDT